MLKGRLKNDTLKPWSYKEAINKYATKKKKKSSGKGIREVYQAVKQ